MSDLHTQKQMKNCKKWKNGCLPFIPERKKEIGERWKEYLAESQEEINEL